MPPYPVKSTRVMLLLPPDLAAFTDQLAAELSSPGLVVNRQDAIRHTLAKLQAAITDETPEKPSVAKPRSRKRPA